ncbi:MAG: hypothetical protein RLZZ450_6661 [Pseudomonadota bacterium]|jgi:hypothetical protein
MAKDVLKKVTVNLPAKLLARVQTATGRGVTETLVATLEEYDRLERRRALRNMAGKVDFVLDLGATR